MSDTNSCKNCDRAFQSQYRYCPYCGQEAADRLTFGVLFSNTVSNYFSVDARFFKSFVPLMFKPGVLARRFVDGRRLTYLHPAQFYLFISVIFFFLFSFSIRKADAEMSNAMRKGLSKPVEIDSVLRPRDSLKLMEAKKALKENQKLIGMSDEELEALDSVMVNSNNSSWTTSFSRKQMDSLIEIGAPLEEKLKLMGMEDDAGGFTRRFYAQLLKMYENRGDGVLNTFYDTIPIAMFFMLPLFAVLLKLFYWRRGTFAHHMVFSFYYFTFLFTLFCVLILISYLTEIPWWIQFLIFMAFYVYLMVALRKFYKSSWLGAVVKSYSVLFLYTIIIIPVAFVGIMLISFMLY